MMTKSTKKIGRYPPENDNANARGGGLLQKICCCFNTRTKFQNLSMQVQALTCDKLSHCLFDFDCVDLNVYEKEQYNYDYFEIKDLRSGPEDTSETTTHDIVLCRSQVHHVAHRDYQYRGYQLPKKDKKGFLEKEEFMRLMFKPETLTLWGFHQSLIPINSIASYKDELSPLQDADEENDVDMNNTLWMVLRKTKPLNETLKRFYAETFNHPIKIKDIIKFGRVNFKVSALSSSKLDNFIQGRYEDVTKNAYNQSNVTQQNLLTQMNDQQRLQSHLTMQHTEMNLNDNSSMTMLNNVTTSKSPRFQGKVDGEESSSQGGQRVCRICLGEYEPSEPENELITPCKCAGSMQYIHIDCLREWMNGKKLVYNGNFVRSFFWKALECELCKTPFENQMKGKLFQIMDFEKPDDNYLIMESVKSAPAKVIHVFFLDKSSEFKIGRSVDTDMKIADISVSRVHSFIKVKNNQLYIEDNGAKFGTLVKIRDPIEILQGGNSERVTNLFQVGRSLLYFGLQNMQKSSKRSKKSIRKIENVSSIQYCNPGYLVTKNMKTIPQQYVYKDPIPRQLPENPTQQQFSLSNLQASKPRTQREDESEIGSPKRQRPQHPENEDNKQQQMITDDIEMRRSVVGNRLQSSLGEVQHQDHQQSSMPRRDSFEQQNNPNSNDPDLQSSVNKGFNDSHIRRSLSPHVMRQVNQQNSERRTHVRNSISNFSHRLLDKKPTKHQRKLSQKQEKMDNHHQQLDKDGSSVLRFYSVNHTKVVKMGIENQPAMADINQGRYQDDVKADNRNGDITSVYRQNSSEDQEAIIEKDHRAIREIVINSSNSEEEKVESPKQVIGRTKKQLGTNKSLVRDAYNDYVSGEGKGLDEIKNVFKKQQQQEMMTRNHTRPEFLDESTNVGGANITTQLSYQNVDPQRTRISHRGEAQSHRRQRDNPTTSGVVQVDEEAEEAEDVLSNQGESFTQHRTGIDGRIIKRKDKKLNKHQTPQID